MACVFDNDADDDDDEDDGCVYGPAGIKQHQLHPECLSAAAARPAVLTHPESEQQRSSSNAPATLTHVHTRLLTTCLNICMYVLLYSKDYG